MPIEAQQKNVNVERVNSIITAIPDSTSNSINDITYYINKNFKSEKDKAFAAFVWIAQNIKYDVNRKIVMNDSITSQELVDSTLTNRGGVCIHYATLYNEIANKLGILSYKIEGYTKQEGKVNEEGHAWNVSRIDSVWYLIDPTWGSGGIIENKFVLRMNEKYFMASPQEMIKSHMPYDPIWQLSDYPITNEEFYGEKRTGTTYFNYKDSIKLYTNQADIERLEKAIQRIDENGVNNDLIQNEILGLRKQIENYRKQEEIDKYNNALADLDEGTKILNTYLDTKNKKLLTTLSDEDIKMMINKAESKISGASLKIKNIRSFDAAMETSIHGLENSIKTTTKKIKDEKIYLNRYFNTNKIFGKYLFDKVN